MQDSKTCASCGNGAPCKCLHHKMVPLFITLIGLVLLLKVLGIVSAGFADISWPVLLILIGLQKMFGGMCGCCKRGM